LPAAEHCIAVACLKLSPADHTVEDPFMSHCPTLSRLINDGFHYAFSRRLSHWYGGTKALAVRQLPVAALTATGRACNRGAYSTVKPGQINVSKNETSICCALTVSLR
jgi:hypothetical protein